MERTFTVTLVRHGETLSNRENIMQGQMDTKLSDVGQKQAQLVAQRLQNETFTHIFTSDLVRAADTAKAIVALNSTCCGLTMDKRLRERGFGVLEGKPVNEYKKALEEAKIPASIFTPEGGETMEEVDNRAKDFYTELCKLMAEPLMSGSAVTCPLLNPPPTFPSSSREPFSAKGSSTFQQFNKEPEGCKCTLRLPSFTGNCAASPKSSHQESSATKLASGSSKSSASSLYGLKDDDVYPFGPLQCGGLQADVGKQLHVDIPDPAETMKNKPSCKLCLLPEVLPASAEPSKTQTRPLTPAPVQVDCMKKYGSPVDNASANVLIVSHGLLLRSLKRLLMRGYTKVLDENNAKEMGRICPNTGVSQFVMSVMYSCNNVTTRCQNCKMLNNVSHLTEAELISHAKFQGAL